jgi:hypothetical protein
MHYSGWRSWGCNWRRCTQRGPWKLKQKAAAHRVNRAAVGGCQETMQARCHVSLALAYKNVTGRVHKNYPHPSFIRINIFGRERKTREREREWASGALAWREGGAQRTTQLEIFPRLLAIMRDDSWINKTALSVPVMLSNRWIIRLVVVQWMSLITCMLIMTKGCVLQ